MLIKCPECELQVSNKALSCPHCGFQLTPGQKNKRDCNSRRHKRLPNGFGQITKISGKNLRNPYRAMVTVGKTPTGTPIAKPLKPKAYFSTYNDAYKALVEYNKNPYDLDSDIIIKELYERWLADYKAAKINTKSGVRTITSAWNYCSELYYMRVKDLRAHHIKDVMEHGEYTLKTGETKTPSPNTKSKIKSMFNLMLDYALEREIVTINVARTFNISDKVLKEVKKNKKKHIKFTEQEMRILWENINAVPWADLVIIQCYSGWRPQELGLIELKNVDLDKKVFYGGMKTDAGVERMVPILPEIEPLVKKYYDQSLKLGSTYLFNCTDMTYTSSSTRLTYDRYSNRFDSVIQALNLNPDHRPHDPRVQFASMAKEAGVDKYAVKKVIGHAITDLTESVYTQMDDAWIIKEITKMSQGKNPSAHSNCQKIQCMNAVYE